MDEVPWVRQVAEAVLTVFSGADGWAVFAHVPGRRRRLVEAFDSRYAAEQGLRRWNRMAEEQTPAELAETIAGTGTGSYGWVWSRPRPGTRRRR